MQSMLTLSWITCLKFCSPFRPPPPSLSITQFIIVFFSCVVLTLRAAFYDVQEATNEDEEDDNGTEIKCNTTYDEDDTINDHIIGASTIVPSVENNAFEISYPSTAQEI